MRRFATGLGLALVLAGGLLVLSRCTTTDPGAFGSDDGPPNPLPACPDSPNCVRVTWVYDGTDADALFEATRAALEATGAATVNVLADDWQLDAVYDVFVFQDDVAAVVEPTDAGAALHLRSASRVGHSDLGVNGRRVSRIQEAVAERIGG